MQDMSIAGILVAIGVVSTSAIVGASLSRDNAITIIGFGSMICVTLLGLIQQIFTAKQAANATKSTEEKLEKAAKKVEEVKETLNTVNTAQTVQLDNIAKVGDATHDLVNSAMATQLKLGMDLSEFKAVTTKSDIDIAAAKLAKSKYDDHVKKQGVVDDKAAHEDDLAKQASTQAVIPELKEIAGQVKDTVAEVKDVVAEIKKAIPKK